VSEIRRLEKEINQLQSQLRQQNTEAARVRQNLIDENRRALQSYRADMKRAIRDRDKDTKAEFERLLSQYQRNLDSDVERRLAKMDANYGKLLDEVKKSETLLLEKNRELEQAITTIRNDLSQKNKGDIQEANQYLFTATGTFRSIEAKPHEKFAPKRLQIFLNTIKDGQQLVKSGLFEAAAAVAISANAGLERLGYTIDDKIEEWDRQYDLFVIKLDYQQEKIKQEVADWATHIGKSEEVCLIELNFWSRGEFLEIDQVVKQYREIAKTISESGKEAYLKTPDSTSTDELKRYISEIDKLDERLSNMSPLCKQRYSAACERADWGEAIIDFFTTEINLIWYENLTGYKNCEVQDSEDFKDYIKMRFGDLTITEDTREWLRLVFENASKEQISVYILPMEGHGIVTNHIVLHIDYIGPEQKQYSRAIYQHLCEAIQYSDEFSGSINYTADVNELKFSENKVYVEAGKDLAKRHVTTERG